MGVKFKEANDAYGRYKIAAIYPHNIKGWEEKDQGIRYYSHTYNMYYYPSTNLFYTPESIKEAGEEKTFKNSYFFINDKFYSIKDGNELVRAK